MAAGLGAFNTCRALGRAIKRLEKQMYDFAKNLEFEKAAAARDELSRLRLHAFGAVVP